MDRCVDCNREGCPLLHLGEYPATDGMCAEDAVRAFNARMEQIQRARFDCLDHRVNWRERALAAEARERWTSIVDRIPDNGEIVEGFTADNTVVTVWVERGRLEQEDGSLYPDGFITHYRPLPAPPEGEP